MRRLKMIADGAVIGELREGDEKTFEVQNHTLELWGQ